jgi:ADP-ribose pyrophosphatase YjhB (NUDIX family)
MGRTEYWHDPRAPEPNSLVPACGVLAADQDGRMLLQRRRDTGQWAIPMGKMEIGETPTQCAIRETQEETGVLVEVTGILGVYSDPAHIVAYDDGEIRQEYEVILLGRPVSGRPAATDEASEAAWFTAADLPGLDIHPTQRRQLDDYLTRSWPHVDLSTERPRDFQPSPR